MVGVGNILNGDFSIFIGLLSGFVIMFDENVFDKEFILRIESLGLIERMFLLFFLILEFVELKDVLVIVFFFRF